ncbi:MAG: CRTAC1 family protein, partial [Phycisphaerae bacterium]
MQNLLFRNRGDGTFEEIGAVAGIAFDAQGQARGAMGIDLTDFRNDGTLGVAIGNFANEMTALYVSPRGQMSFTDEA